MLRWANRHKFALLLLVWLATLIAWAVDRTRVWLDGKYYPTRHRRMLVYDLDHAPIRDACRDVLEVDRRAVPSTRPTTLAMSKLPPALAILKPGGVHVDARAGYVSVMFGGGFHHWSLDFYEDASQARGTKDLGEGLWFSDEGGQVPSR